MLRDDDYSLAKAAEEVEYTLDRALARQGDLQPPSRPPPLDPVEGAILRLILSFIAHCLSFLFGVDRPGGRRTLRKADSFNPGLSRGVWGRVL